MQILPGQEKDWCTNYGTFLGQERGTPRLPGSMSTNALDFKQGYKRPKRIRCKVCGRLLIPQTIDVEPNSFCGEWTYRLPIHKIKKSKRIKNRRRK